MPPKVTMAQKKAAIAEKAAADKAAKNKAFADACKECEAVIGHPPTMADTQAYIEMQKKIEKESASAEKTELLKLTLKSGFFPYAEWEDEQGNYVACCCDSTYGFSILPCFNMLPCCKPQFVCHMKPCCSCKCFCLDACCKDCMCLNCCSLDCCKSKPFGIEICGWLHIHVAKWPVCLSVSAASQHFSSP
jgi:hypothetical protein